MTSPIINPIGGDDGNFFRQSITEVASVFEERVLLRRYTGETAGDPDAGTGATPAYTDIKTFANITAVTARELMAGNSILRLGDLKCDLRIPIYGGEQYTGDQQAKGRRPDLIIYRGRTYFVVGIPERPFNVNPVFYSCFLRQQQ